MKEAFIGVSTVDRIIKVHDEPLFEEIARVSSGIKMVSGEMSEPLINDLFPLMNLDSWVSKLIDSIPEGRITTFGDLASALGDRKASWAIGEVIARGIIEGPVHRVIYSDGRVPSRSLNMLSCEIEILESGKISTSMDNCSVKFEVTKPPLISLAGLQLRMRDNIDLTVRNTVLEVAGLDISSKDEMHVAALSVMDLDGNAIGSLYHLGVPGLPYIPGLLFYREAPLLLPLIHEAQTSGMIGQNTLLVLDGNGTLHPKRAGLACQIGVSTSFMRCGVA